MPRIEPLIDAPGDELFAKLMRNAREDGTPDERMVKVFARSDLGARWLDFCHAVFYEGLLPHRLKELIRIRLSVAEECGYCSSLRSKLAQAQGLTEEIVLEMLDLDASTNLAEQEKAAIRYADRYRRDEVDSDEVFDELRRFFSDEEIIELGVLCSILDGGGKFAKALQVLTWGEACEVQPSLRELQQPARI